MINLTKRQQWVLFAATASAALVWERTTGEKPPQPRTGKRKRRLPRR